ncbi:MAG: hypothetical protein Q9208_002691 [Pyrenodesmia sp. 3 TL-2023]
MDTIKNAANYVSSKAQGTGAEASKETNKSIAKDSNVKMGTRLRAAGDAMSDKMDQHRHELARIGLRRIAFRVLSNPSTSTPCRNRAFNTATAFTSRSRLQSLPISRFQRRFASEEAETQSEPSADRSEEGQHGDNSIAASSQESQPPAEEHSSEAPESSSESQSAGSEQPRTVGELASAAAEKTKEAVSSAYSSVTGQDAFETGSGSGFSRRSPLGQPDRPMAPPSPTVYVGNLFFDVREDDLRREFEKVGPIENVKLIMDNRGLSKGFGYVTFASQDAATAAIATHNQQNFEGRRLTVQYATGRTGGPPSPRSTVPSPPSRTLFIGNMAFDMSDRELNNLFREIRNVIDVRVAIDRRTGQPRGFAHADFTDVESAKEAMVVLAGKEVCGRTLRVDYSQGSGRVGRRDDGGDSEQGQGQQQQQQQQQQGY